MTDMKNLYQRVQAVAQQVGKVEADVRKGEKDQYGKPALTIGSVEDVLRDALAEAGIITRWAVIGAEPVDSKPAGWRVVMHCTFVNVDNPSDLFEDEVTDTGGNISAAGSFAVKAYYRRLFHLSVEDDDTPRQQKQDQGARNAPKQETHANFSNEPENPFNGHAPTDSKMLEDGRAVNTGTGVVTDSDEASRILTKAFGDYEAFFHVNHGQAVVKATGANDLQPAPKTWTPADMVALATWLNNRIEVESAKARPQQESTSVEL